MTELESLGEVSAVIGGDQNIRPKIRKCLRDPHTTENEDWTDIPEENFRKYPGRYVKVGTLRINNELITFYDLNF